MADEFSAEEVIQMSKPRVVIKKKPSIVSRMASGAYKALTQAPKKVYSYRPVQRTWKGKKPFYAPPAGRGAARVPLRGARMLFPFLPEGTTVIRGQGRKKVGGGRGRPRGTYKYRNTQGNPISVFEWRRQQRAARAYQRYAAVNRTAQLRSQMQQVRQARPQYQQAVPQQYQTEEIPVEAQMEMAQMQQSYPEQMRQYPQQYPQAPRREVRPVFKSSGGSPFNPVPTAVTAPSQLLESRRTIVQQPQPQKSLQHLAPVRDTMHAGYVEATDPWTGQRFIKRLPPQERWQGD